MGTIKSPCTFITTMSATRCSREAGGEQRNLKDPVRSNDLETEQTSG